MGRWWRAYDEAVDDPKLILLTDRQHRAWFNLCCICSQNGGALPSASVIAVKLRMSVERAARVVAELAALNLVDVSSGEPATMHNWAGRQYLSDSSIERVKRHREKRKAAGLVGQWCAPPALRQAVYERDGFRCVYCGASERLSLDHRMPEIRGGSHEIENLATACMACNGAKRDLTEEEFRERYELSNVSMPLPKRSQNTENREQRTEYSEPNGSADVVGEDPRAKLFREGKTILVSFGVGEKRCGSVIGQWLKAKNDPDGILGALKYARSNNVAEPVAYVSAIIHGRAKNGTSPTMDAFDRLADSPGSEAFGDRAEPIDITSRCSRVG